MLKAISKDLKPFSARVFKRALHPQRIDSSKRLNLAVIEGFNQEIMGDVLYSYNSEGDNAEIEKKFARKFRVYRFLACGFLISLVFLAGLSIYIILKLPEAGLRPSASVSLTLSQFSESHGIGSQASLTVAVVTKRDLPVTLIVGWGAPMGGWPSGIDITWLQPPDYYQGGAAFWSLNLLANVPAKVNATVKAVRIGYWEIKAQARWYDNTTLLAEESAYSKQDIAVYEKEIFIGEFYSLPRNPIIYAYTNETYPGSSIYIEPKRIEWTAESHSLGETLTLEARVTNLTRLFSVGFSLKWNSSVLQFVGVQKGTALESKYPNEFLAVSDNLTESIAVAYLQFGMVQVRDLNETQSGLVSTITFRAINYGSTNIEFVNEIDSHYKTIWLRWGDDKISDYNFESMKPAAFDFNKNR